tara:strand:+ start:30127 stop:30363 length:237 start_codon:yes stop_codon:yes gene_type:complete
MKILFLLLLTVSCSQFATSEWVSDNTYKVKCPQQYDSSCYKKIEKDLCPNGHKILHKKEPLIGQYEVVVRCEQKEGTK